MTCGLPIVAFDAGGVGDLVSHEVTGLLVEKGNVVEVAKALSRLAGDDKLRAGISNNCKNLSQANYNPRDQASKYIDVYRSLLIL